LILQVVLGLDAKTIASAFLTSPAAMGKRLGRAKDKIRQAGIPFSVPEREELPGGLTTVLDAIYAGFTEVGPTQVGRISPAAISQRKLCSWPGCDQLLRASRKRWVCLHSCFTRKPAAARAQSPWRLRAACEQDPGLWDSQMIEEAEALLRRATLWASLSRPNGKPQTLARRSNASASSIICESPKPRILSASGT